MVMMAVTMLMTDEDALKSAPLVHLTTTYTWLMRTQTCVEVVTPLLSERKLTKTTTTITAHVGSIAQVVNNALLPIHPIDQDKTCNLQ